MRKRRKHEVSEPTSDPHGFHAEQVGPQLTATGQIPVAALAKFSDLREGESVSITLGAEMYSPVQYRNFSVGPFSGTVVVRPGETGADAAMRLYRVLLELNEAEFQVAWGRHKDRLVKTGTKV